MFPHDPSGEVVSPLASGVAVGIGVVELGTGTTTLHFPGVEWLSLHPVQSSMELPQRPYLLQQEYPVRDGKFSQEYLLPHEPSGDVTRPPGRTVGVGVAGVVDVVDEVVDVLKEELEDEKEGEDDEVEDDEVVVLG